MSKKQPAQPQRDSARFAISFPHGMTLQSLQEDVFRLQSFAEALRLSLLAAANQRTLGIESRSPADVGALSDLAQEVNELIWKTIGELSGRITVIDDEQAVAMGGA